MRIEKIQDNLSLVDNLDKGDIMIYSQSEYADEITISPQNIHWVNYSTHQGVSLKSFDKGEKLVLYPELKQDNFWYVLRLNYLLTTK
jgi:hypothetical protein